VKPRALLMITAHWEESTFAVDTAKAPGMIYDYGGFPEHTYNVRYPAAGAPEVAEEAARLLEGAGLEVRRDPTRGYDHGTFTPLAVMYPKADMPIAQMSIRRDYDVEAHLQAGRALAPLRERGVLIVGSGLSYHNLRAFGARGREASAAFDKWLAQTLADPQRERLLHDWTKAPMARQAHPREDHLVPLLMAVGAAAGEPVRTVYHEDEFMGGITVSSYRFG
jgi:aromatic ring-opening dioxygenase catalytic subunit (LigB family)